MAYLMTFYMVYVMPKIVLLSSALIIVSPQTCFFSDLETAKADLKITSRMRARYRAISHFSILAVVRWHFNILYI